MFVYTSSINDAPVQMPTPFNKGALRVLANPPRHLELSKSCHAFCALVFLSILVFQAGCRDQGAIEPDNRDSATDQQSASSAQKANVVIASTSARGSSPASRNEADLTIESSPQEVCREFLRALQKRDLVSAGQLLTSRAIVETHRANLELAFPGGENSSFEVCPPEYASSKQQMAQVDCIIRHPDDSEPFRLSWMMKLQRSGWKISGMTFQNDQNGSIDLLSFENPLDVARIKSAVSDDSSEIGPVNNDTRQAKSSDDAQKRLK